MKQATAFGLVLIVAGVVASPGGSPAQDLGSAVRESYSTNLHLLAEATRSSVAELFLGFSAPEGATLLVEGAGDHEAGWFVENHLLSHLTQTGYHAYLKPGDLIGPGLPATDAGDSLTGAADSARPPLDQPAAEADELPHPEYVLRYRVVHFELSYPNQYRKSPLGARNVQRRVSVSIFAQLLKGEREDVIWVGNGDVERLDVVPASKLPLLEGQAFPFTRPNLETRGLGGLVEPALVSGIVAGLIYLFYTNQN